MSLRVRFQYSQGESLGYSIERLSDAYNYDFSDGMFKNTAPTTQVSALSAGTGNRAGIYSVTLTPTPTNQFSNGDYAIYINDLNAANAVIGVIGCTMIGGDDGSQIVSDPWSIDLSSYTSGQAGYLIYHNIDASVSSLATAIASISSTLASMTFTIDPRIMAVWIGNVRVNDSTHENTFYDPDAPTTPIVKFGPDGSDGRNVTDLRV